MPNLTTRAELKSYALRALGHGVIEINVSDAQIEDRIDEALQYFGQNISSGSRTMYYKYQITDQDKTNKYISTTGISPNMISVVRVFSAGGTTQTNNMWNVRYQMALTDFYGLRNGDFNMTSWTVTQQYLEMMQQLLDPEKQIRFNTNDNILYIDTVWSDYATGSFLLIEAVSTLDPTTTTEIYNNGWLKKYTKALIKKQWGSNLSKYQGIQMPGSVTFNGATLYLEAVEEIALLEAEAVSKFQEPPNFIVG